MKVQVVGCGDAFGAGGRGNTCFRVAAEGIVATLDFGASTPVALNRLGLSGADIDIIFLSHLHGDHFGGIPFLLLDGQYVSRRDKPLLVVGPPGTRERLHVAAEALFPGTMSIDWRFAFEVREVAPGSTTRQGPFSLTTAQVVHSAGAPATALRLQGSGPVLAFSGDTEWTDALIPIADGADLFICESFGFDTAPPGHLAYLTLEQKRAALGAKRVLLTHMGAEMLARSAEVDRDLFELAEDGLQLIV